LSEIESEILYNSKQPRGIQYNTNTSIEQHL